MSLLMMDLEGVTLSQKEREQIQHPMVGGLILFTRNFESKAQLIGLVKSIREVKADILIAVDHEGGRVQRFRDGFTHIPAMGDILPASNGDIELAKERAKELGFLMAIELLACDIDLSFAPVLDVDDISEVIGKRGFSSEPSEIIELASEFIDGMRDAGMAAVGKHFPGHGSVQADSHLAIPKDERSKEDIFNKDILPFKSLISSSKLQGIMPAHVIYTQVDPKPAGFSEYWQQQILRNELGFDGVIFSDDLGMEGASFAGDFIQRADAALKAGCDMILVCNNPGAVESLLKEYQWPINKPKYSAAELKADFKVAQSALQDEQRWLNANQIANKLN
ncbi:beta-N-acetylhexosaminidase [Shewanella sp. 202IG2-18]|uniref:beta-N-acetylhexosaminidase n=1 Tax=Parashewanella hymeniacidonis TaxID=2807618 RepID=UPI00195F842A|nr:beta-N-acetylhexosaminidase [Parashewanella hymeniacidonis]MBM7074081.1 beta-N-acetylhexosaminidase [Parashewanella hymeniacidonis]